MKRPATVVRDVQLHAKHIDACIALGIDADLREIHRSRIGRRELGPRPAGIVGTIRAALALMLDTGVHDVWILAIDVESNAA